MRKVFIFKAKWHILDGQNSTLCVRDHSGSNISILFYDVSGAYLEYKDITFLVFL